MKTVIAALVLVSGLTLSARTADPELAGAWFGSVDTDRGQMEIGLSVTADKGQLKGALKTMHGDWEVTRIAEKNGEWTVAFKGGGNEGTMVGRIKGAVFAGDWKSVMANGTFELTRSKKKN